MDTRYDVDKGVLFAKENTQKALDAAKKSRDLYYLEKSIQRELVRISTITKTGDLIRYYRRFSSYKHHYAAEFALLSEEVNGTFIPSEKLADYLASHFPEESSNATTINDFEYGASYKNDYLSVVLGGNYARSFRFSKDHQVSYLVVNAFEGANKWEEDGDTFFYSPYDRNNKGIENSKAIFNIYRNYRTLIFQKRQTNDLVYLGIFHLAGIESPSGRLIFRREFPIFVSGRYERSEFCEDPSLMQILPESMDSVEVVREAVVELAEENGIDYSSAVLEDGELYKIVLFTFPYGFYELLGTFDNCSLVVANKVRLTKSFKDLLREKRHSSRYFFIVDCQEYRSNQISSDVYRRIGWQPLENKIREISDVNPSFVKNDKEGSFLKRIIPRIKLEDGKSRIAIYRFLVDALAMDYMKSERGERTDVVAERMIKTPSGKTFIPDLWISGFYERLNLESPVFEIRFNFKFALKRGVLDPIFDFRSPVVFIDVQSDRSYEEVIKGKSCLVLGRPFIVQLARLYPDIYSQYVLENLESQPKEVEKNGLADKLSDFDAVASLENNRKMFQNLLETSDQKISIIAGNGVSIPFGSDSWDDLTKNILNQLQPRFVESAESVQEFFGKISFSTNDFVDYTLEDNRERKLFQQALKYSIYRRYSKYSHKDDTAIKAICEAKHKYWNRISLFTYNYDTFIEDQYNYDYTSSSLRSAIRDECDTAPTSSLDIVIHSHGRFVPNSKKGEDIILTRRQYFNEYNKKTKKQLLKLKDALQNNICLFVGSSMTDIFQLTMIEENSSNYGDEHKPRIYALLPVGKYKEKKKLIKALYRYFLEKDVLIISFDKFEELPKDIRELFLLTQ